MTVRTAAACDPHRYRWYSACGSLRRSSRQGSRCLGPQPTAPSRHELTHPLPMAGFTVFGSARVGNPQRRREGTSPATDSTHGTSARSTRRVPWRRAARGDRDDRRISAQGRLDRARHRGRAVSPVPRGLQPCARRGRLRPGAGGLHLHFGRRVVSGHPRSLGHRAARLPRGAPARLRGPHAGGAQGGHVRPAQRRALRAAHHRRGQRQGQSARRRLPAEGRALHTCR